MNDINTLESDDIIELENKLFQSLYEKGCITQDKFWIANTLETHENDACVMNVNQYTSRMIDMQNIQNMLYRFCEINNFPTTATDPKAAMICGNMIDDSWLVNGSTDARWKGKTRSLFEKWCRVADDDLREKRSQFGICKCFNDSVSEEARENLDRLCGIAGSGSSLCAGSAPPECSLVGCKTQDTPYGITYNTSCPPITLCNINFSGDVTAGEINIACGITNICDDQGKCDEAAKEKLCRLAECTSTEDKNCSGGGKKPDFCVECNKDPGTQACYNEMGIPCACSCRCEPDPNHPFSCEKCKEDVQCQYCSEECDNNKCGSEVSAACKECRARCHVNKPEASCGAYGNYCDIGHDESCCSNPKTCNKPQCCAIDVPTCHVVNPLQSCYDEQNIPCLGPIAKQCVSNNDTTSNQCLPYWMCHIGREECHINFPPQVCYAEANKPCEGPEPPIGCVPEQEPIPCWGGSNCVCESSVDIQSETKLEHNTHILFIILTILIVIVCIISSIVIFGLSIMTIIISVVIIATSSIVWYLLLENK